MPHRNLSRHELWCALNFRFSNSHGLRTLTSSIPPLSSSRDCSLNTRPLLAILAFAMIDATCHAFPVSDHRLIVTPINPAGTKAAFRREGSTSRAGIRGWCAIHSKDVSHSPQPRRSVSTWRRAPVGQGRRWFAGRAGPAARCRGSRRRWFLTSPRPWAASCRPGVLLLLRLLLFVTSRLRTWRSCGRSQGCLTSGPSFVRLLARSPRERCLNGDDVRLGSIALKPRR